MSIKFIPYFSLADWPVELPRFDLSPGSSQVVFEGDSLPFECRATVVDAAMRLYWVRNDEAVETNDTLGVHVTTQYSPDMTEMTTRLVVDFLKVGRAMRYADRSDGKNVF